MNTDHTQAHLDPAEVADVSMKLDRLANADSVMPEGMQARIAAAASAASRQHQSAVAGRISSSSGLRRVSPRQWAMAAMLFLSFGIGFAVLSRLSDPTGIPSENVASAVIVQQDMESWLSLTETKDETFNTTLQQIVTDTTRVTESVTSTTTTTIDGDSL